jgi:antitoxin HicB
LEGCYTCGDDMVDSLSMAEDVLALVLYSNEKKGRKIPAPSCESRISLSEGEFINFVACNALEYRVSNFSAP